ncbi:MAG TPA: hypothetical protein VGB20_00740 [bacterium]
MMADVIQIRVLTHEGIVAEARAMSVVAPGEPGAIGFLRNHAPLVTTLSSGRLWWRTPEGAEETMMIGDGLLEIVRNRLTILTSSAAKRVT